MPNHALRSCDSSAFFLSFLVVLLRRGAACWQERIVTRDKASQMISVHWFAIGRRSEPPRSADPDRTKHRGGATRPGMDSVRGIVIIATGNSHRWAQHATPQCVGSYPALPRRRALSRAGPATAGTRARGNPRLDADPAPFGHEAARSRGADLAACRARHLLRLAADASGGSTCAGGRHRQSARIDGGAYRA